MSDHSDVNHDELPFAAPCRNLSPWAPFNWVKQGIGDLMQAPQQSMAYGLAVALMIGIVCLLAWFRGSHWFMFAMLGGFVFLAPLTCIGLYAISAQIERGQPVLMARSLRAAFRRHLGNEMIFAIILLVIFLVWARAAIMVTVFFPTDGELTWEVLWPYLTFGSLVGSVLPLLFRSLGLDPALMSNPFVSAIVDVVGIVLYMSIAFAVLG